MQSTMENEAPLALDGENMTFEKNWAFPMSFAQQRFWLLNQLEPGNTAYSIPCSMRLRGKLDVQALENSLNEIVSRHEVFRTTFKIVDGEPAQIVAPSLRVPLPVKDLSAWLECDRESEAARLAKEEADTPLDLENGPLIRSQLIRLSDLDHILLLTLHHIIFDGWSRRIFARELAACYEAFQKGQLASLPPLSLQYADFAVWQRKLLAHKNFDKQLTYWKKQLANAPAGLDLPTDRPRPAIQSYRGAKVPASLSPALSQHVAQFAREQTTSTFMVLLAAFQSLLSRYTGDEDILVGTPIANRTRPEIENLIGLFANTLVLRGNVAGNPSFAELVRRVKQTALDAYAHQDMPFEKLVEEVNPERSLSRNPLFQVMFSLQNAAPQAFQLSGVELQLLEAPAETAKFDFSVFLSDTEQGIRGRVEYNTDLYDKETIERLWGHYVTLLEAAVKDPELRLAELPLLTEAEREQLLVEWNDTTTKYPRELCVHTWFEQQAAHTPDAVACVWQGAEISYRELNERANQLAWYLRRLGAGPGERVGIYVDRSTAMLVGLLGIQKSGAAYVPLDPAYPAERLRLMLEEARVTALVTEQRLESGIPEAAGVGATAAKRVCLDRDADGIAREDRANPPCITQPDDLIYVIFTSGSTGRPKGVEISHRSVVNLLSSMAQKLNMGPEDVFPALASFAFDMCIPELYLALVTGGRVAIGRERLAGDGHELAAFFRQVGATVVHATPSSWRLLLEAGFTGAGLKRAIGAEALPPEVCARLLEAEPSLYNFYGPTETTVWSTMHHFRNPNEPVVVGRPLANTRIYILDRERQPVPVGVEGELYIGGTGVAHGYLHRPDLTAERFLSDPYNPGGRMYRTGDRARYLRDGRIEYLGRSDFQVKLRGYRIELGEIEAVLARHTGVKQCVAAVREDSPGDRRLVAYVVSENDAVAGEAEWRAWIKERLPEYMVPVRIVRLVALPLTANGKVDRKHLPAVEYRRGEGEEAYEAPHTAVEEVIAEIWCEVLKLDRVGVQDNFFHLGGHSLLGMQVVSRVRQAFSVEVPLRTLFEVPNVAGLAQQVESSMRGRTSSSIPAVTRVERPKRLPLSFAQQRLWFIDQLEPGNALYNIPHVVRFIGQLNRAVLERSINEIVRRHEVLRTRFVLENGEALQVIEPSKTVPLVITSVGSVAAEQRETEARRLVIGEIQRPFDLKTAPLMRALLIQLSDDDHVLALTFHHTICDGWSVEVFSGELAALYDAMVENRSPQLKDPAVQYADYTLWQRKFLSGEQLEQEIKYWKRQLAGAPEVLELPCDHPYPASRTFLGGEESVVLSKTLLADLKRFTRAEGVTLFMALLAAFKVLLSRYSGQTDIVVGSPIAGRNCTEVEKLIGLFVNTLALRTSLAGKPTFRELLKRIRETAMEAYAHQDLPFEKLVEEMNPSRDAGHNPLFQVALVVQNMPRQDRRLRDLAVAPFAIKNPTSKFDLTLIAREHTDGLRVLLEYSTDLFDSSTIRRMLQHYQALLECAIKKPDLCISDLSLLTTAEQQQLLDWGRTSGEYPRDASVQQLFDEQVKARPAATALEFGGTRLTYSELQQRANQLAQYLRGKGIGPGVLVGLCVERSIEMIVGLLGILKAGAAYVPLDPSYPAERLSFMLEDTRIPLLLTQAHLLPRLPQNVQIPTVCLDRESDFIEHEQVFGSLPESQPEDVAYIMYTSGSTGRPKGVAIPHRGILRLVCNPGYVHFSPDDVLLQFAPISFDASTFEIWGALLNGSKLVIFRPHSPSLQELASTIQYQRITVLFLTTELFHVMVEHHLPSLRNVKQLLTGGDVLSVPHVRRVVEELKQCLVANAYGPTENTTITTCHSINLDTIGSSVPIGRPISNTQVYILDENRQLLPIGVAGELYTGGDGLARGYWDSPELTAERFVHVDGLGRLYRTGDRCRWRNDGVIEFLGRNDNQVKLRGYRIELGEVEATLSQHAAVARSLAMVREDKPGVRQLVAYVVPQPGARVQSEELLQHLKNSLPEFMVPGVVMILEKFPLSPSGKIDRHALPQPELMHRQKEQEGSGPRDEIERALFEIWKEVLGINCCTVTDNFFELGGHSLLLLVLGALIEKKFNKVVPLPVLFKSATIEAIATFLRAESASEPEFLVPLNDKGTGPAFFCVHPILGEVMMFRHLANLLDSDQRFVGVQFPPELRTPESVSSIEGVAARYVDALLAFEPRGPYLLGGWSSGVSVALEMAQQLQARGHTVELLAAIDAAPPNNGVSATRRTPLYYWKLVRNFPRWMAEDVIANFSWKAFFHRAGRSLSGPVRRTLAARRGAAELANYKVSRIIKAGCYSESAQLFFKAFYRVLHRYVPKPYNGRVVLYKAKTQGLFILREPDRVWRSLAKEVEVVEVDGNHVSLMDERHVKSLAEDLNRRLRQYRALYQNSTAQVITSTDTPLHGEISVASEASDLKTCEVAELTT